MAPLVKAPLKWWPIRFMRRDRHARTFIRRRFFMHTRTNGGYQDICIGKLRISIGRPKGRV